MKDGDEGYSISYQEETGAVLFSKRIEAEKVTVKRVIHLSSCAWIEWLHTDGPMSITVTSETMAASKANPDAFQKIEQPKK